MRFGFLVPTGAETLSRRACRRPVSEKEKVFGKGRLLCPRLGPGGHHVVLVAREDCQVYHCPDQSGHALVSNRGLLPTCCALRKTRLKPGSVRRLRRLHMFQLGALSESLVQRRSRPRHRQAEKYELFSWKHFRHRAEGPENSCRNVQRLLGRSIEHYEQEISAQFYDRERTSF